MPAVGNRADPNWVFRVTPPSAKMERRNRKRESMSYQAFRRLVGMSVLTASLGVALMLTGCTGTGNSNDLEYGQDEGPSEPEPVFEAPSDEEIRDALSANDRWTCSWAPSMNNDWHDDIVCRKGSDLRRPILLPESGFVTQAQMEEAGDAYAAQLNAALPTPPSGSR